MLHQHCQDKEKLNAESTPQQLTVLDDALCLRQHHAVGRVHYHILLQSVHAQVHESPHVGTHVRIKSLAIGIPLIN